MGVDWDYYNRLYEKKLSSSQLTLSTQLTKKQPGFFDRVIGAVAPAFEPLSALQQGLFASTSDITKMIKGTYDPAESLTRRWLSELPAYAPYGAAPQSTVRFRDLLGQWGVKNETALTVFGFAGDVLADPLLVTGFAKGIATAVKAPSKVIAALDAADKAFVPSTYIQAAGRALKGTTVGNTAEAIAKNILDTKISPPFIRNRGGTTIGELTIGRDYIRMLTPEIKGVTGAVDTGAFTGSSREGMGAMTISVATGNKVAQLIASTIRENQSMLTDAVRSGLTARGNGNRGDINAIVAQVDSWAGSLIDRRTKQITPASQAFPAAPLASRVVPWTPMDRAIPVSEAVSILQSAGGMGKRELASTAAKAAEAIKTTQAAKVAEKKLSEFLDSIGVEPATVLPAFRQVVAKGIALTSTAGYQLSEFDTFRKTLDSVLPSVPELAARFGNDALTPYVATMRFGSEKAAKVYGISEKSMADFVTGARQAFAQLPQFQKLDPNEYVNGVIRGYNRRVLGGIFDPESAITNVEKGNLIPLKAKATTAQISDLRSRLPGDDDALDQVAKFLNGMPTLAVATPRLHEVYRAAGGKAKYSDFVAAVKPVFMDDDYAKETIARLQQYEAALRPATFQERKALDDATLAQLAEIPTSAGRLAGYGVVAAPKLKVQEFIKRSYLALDGAGAVLDEGAYVARAKMGDIDQRAWAKMGDDPTLGPLAGKFVPKEYKQIYGMFSATADPVVGLNGLGRVVSQARAWALGNPGTYMRNLVGNLALMYSAGLNPLAVVGKMKDAWDDYAEFRATGTWKSAEMQEAADQFQFLGNAGIKANLREPVEIEMLQGVVAQSLGSKSPASVIQRLAATVTDIENRLVTDKPAFQVQTPGLADLGTMGTLADIAKTTAKSTAMSVAAAAFPAYWVNSFAHLEDTFRVAIYKSQRDILEKGGMDKAEALNRATYLAANATFDYSNVSGAVDILRKTGLSMFPAFPYFAAKRVADQVLNRPGTLAAQSRVPMALQTAFVPDEEDQRSLDAMLADYLTSQSPLAMPIQGEDGKYRVLSLSNFMSDTIVQPDVQAQFFSDIANGGVFRPIVEVVRAFASGDGKATITEKFGRQVFDPTAGTAERVAQAFEFLLGDYAPSLYRNIESAGRTILGAPLISAQNSGQSVLGRIIQDGFYDIPNDQVRKNIELITGKYMNSDPGQITARFLGARTTTVDITGGISLQQRVKAINAQAQSEEEFLSGQIKKLSQEYYARPSDRALQQIQELSVKLTQLKMKRSYTLMDLLSRVQSQ